MRRLCIVEDLISLNDHCSSQTLEIAAKKPEIDTVMETNKELQGYVENIIGISITSGPKDGFEDIDRSCQRKLLKQIESRMECALWFNEGIWAGDREYLGLRWQGAKS